MIKQYFVSFPDTISACCLDLWKSRASTHFLGVILNFITEDWKMHNVALSLLAVTERHTADIIKEMTTRVLDDFGVVPSCFVADSASNQVLSNEKLAHWSDQQGTFLPLSTSM